MKITSLHLLGAHGTGRRIVYLAVLAVALLLPGCLAEKDREALRQENARKDVEQIREPEAYKTPAAKSSKAKGLAEAPAPGAPGAPKVPLKPNSPLGLDDAVSFALERNLDKLVAAQEKSVQEEMVTGAKYRLLPNLLIDADRSQKSWDVGSTSISLYTRQVSLEPSISSELNSFTYNAGLSWDLLNLGVNIVRWRQSEGRADIAAERLRRAKQDIALNVTRAYLKAAVSKDAASHAQALLDEGRKRREIIKKQIAEGTLSKVDGLQSDAGITEMMLRLKTYSSDYRSAMTELSELLGLKPEDMADIKDMDLSRDPKPRRFDIAALEGEALSKRPELFQQDIEQKISQQDADAAFMQMFPSVTPYIRYSYDSNKYLSKNDWYIIGVKLSFDLFSVPRLMYERFTAKQQADLAAKRRMKIALSVLTQVRLSIIEYNETTDRLQLAGDLVKERFELLEAVREQVRTGKLRESMLLDEDQRYLNARVQHLTNYAGALIALARLDNSLGRDWGGQPAGPLTSENAAPTLAAAKARQTPAGPADAELAATQAPSAQEPPELTIAVEPVQKNRAPAGSETKAVQPAQSTAAGSEAKAVQPAQTGSRDVTINAYGGLRSLTLSEKPGLVAVNIKTMRKPGETTWEYLDNPPRLVFHVGGRWVAKNPFIKYAGDGEYITAVHVDQSRDALGLALEFNESDANWRRFAPVIETADGGLLISVKKEG
ncbi:MAG: TolC family protein [Desulfovibrionaceae bacterium]|nr:TolC family protein [Desulfovibrionaceae bacterium]MBF0513500.1 TolC family protein [Desulfovibrionaceae bacterium]